MTLVKMTPTPVKTFAVSKATVSSPAGKSPPTMMKPVDVTSSSKKPPAPSSPIKGKPTSAPMKPATKTVPSAVKVEKSPIKTEKSPVKSIVTKASINSTTKSPPTVNKSSISKSSATEAKIPIRSVIKPITPKTPERKQLDSNKENSTVHSSEKLTSNKTNVNSPPVPKTPSKSSSMVKNILLSPAKSVSSSIRSVSSPSKSVSSPIKPISSLTKSISSPVKSISSPTKSLSSPVKSITPPTKSVSSSIKSISSPTKSVSSAVKSISSPLKSVSSPIKSILSPLKPKTTREVNLSSAVKIKDTNTTTLSLNSLTKKPLNLPKSPIKPTAPSKGKIDVSSKLKPNTKNSPTSKVVKNNTILTKPMIKKQPSIVETVEVSNLSSCTVEKLDLRHCDNMPEKGEESSNSPALITEYTIDNTSNFDVARAFKVAEQLIKIQSNDRNLETIIETSENNSVINWDDVITPCDDFAVSGPNNKIESTSLEQNDLPVLSFASEESASKCDSCTTETTNSQALDSKLDGRNDNSLVISPNRDENNNIIGLINVVDPSSISSQFTEIELKDKEHSTNEIPFIISDDVSILNRNNENESAEIESNDEEYLTKEHSFDCADDSIENHCDKNVLPEWTITIDEFSLDLAPKEIQTSDTTEKDNYTADETPCTVGSVSYADILKKTPKVFANSTNLEFSRKQPKVTDDTQIKSYQTMKKGKTSCSKDMSFDDIENKFQNCDDLYDAPDYCEMRKKKHKKIKHLSKRHMRNINRECEYIESHSDIFVTHVWKNIF